MTKNERQQLEDVLQRIDKVNNELMALDDGPVDMDSLMQALEALSIKINDILEEAADEQSTEM